MDESQSINVVFCFDKNFVNCTTVAIFSLLKNSKSPIHLHLIVSDIPDGALAPIKELASTYQATLLIYRPENFAQYEWKTLNHWTEATYLRLIIPDLIDVDKIIYLDGDVIVTQD